MVAEMQAVFPNYFE